MRFALRLCTAAPVHGCACARRCLFTAVPVHASLCA